jgi:hypothetical protein
MAYITAEEVAAIRAQLKAKYPEYKFGVRKSSGGLSVGVTIKQGPRDFSDIMDSRNYAQINQYWINDHYPRHAEFLNDIMEIIKTAPAAAPGGRAWFDESDAMTDYFHTAYYIDLNVGDYNKPYAQVR